MCRLPRCGRASTRSPSRKLLFSSAAFFCPFLPLCVSHTRAIVMWSVLRRSTALTAVPSWLCPQWARSTMCPRPTSSPPGLGLEFSRRTAQPPHSHNTKTRTKTINIWDKPKFWCILRRLVLQLFGSLVRLCLVFFLPRVQVIAHAFGTIQANVSLIDLMFDFLIVFNFFLKKRFF